MGNGFIVIHTKRVSECCVQVWYRVPIVHQPFRAVGNILVHSQLKYIHINLGAIQDPIKFEILFTMIVVNKIFLILDRAKIDN